VVGLFGWSRRKSYRKIRCDLAPARHPRHLRRGRVDHEIHEVLQRDFDAILSCVSCLSWLQKDTGSTYPRQFTKSPSRSVETNPCRQPIAEETPGSKKQTCGTPASGIASAVRVSEISRDGHVIENRQGLTRGADAQPLAGSANPGWRSFMFLNVSKH
jgi:hypothetical protein